MKKLIIITIVAACSLPAVYVWAATYSANTFKYHMHQIFDNYNNANISLSLKKFDITNIYLQHLLASIDSAKEHVPDNNMDGTKLDKELFTKRIEQLRKSVSTLKFINDAKYREPFLTESLSKEMFNMCVTCHKEVKKDSLFKIPARTTLFGKYMHKVSENLDLALIKSEDESLSDEVNDHVQLVNYYVDLLVPIFPISGPSGVIMDREHFHSLIMEIKKDLKKEGKAITTAGLEQSRTTLNGLCVTCHEPERIK